MPSKVFDTGDPFEYWIKQAYKFEKEINLPADFATEAIAIIKGAFGEQWIRDELKRRDRSAPFLRLREHPIANCFTSPAEPQLVKIFELAIYIKKLIRCRELYQVIKQMKDENQFATGLLQLAFAYRFQKLDAKNIELEPDADKGRKGDIYFEYGGNKFMVECYIPHTSSTMRTSFELHNSIGPIFDVIDKYKLILRVSIKLKRSITVIDRREIEKTVTHLIDKIGDQKHISTEVDSANITIDNIQDLKEDNDFPKSKNKDMDLYGGADWGVNQQRVHIEQIQNARDGKLANTKRLSRVLVWEPECEKKEPDILERVEELTDKIEKKLSQTKKSEKSIKRLLIVGITEARDKKNKNVLLAFRKIQHNIVRAHLDVAGVFMASRNWTTRSRYQYSGILLTGRAKDSLAERFFEEFNILEADVDLLEDWR